MEDAVAVVMRNSRTPELVAGDIRAQIGATRMGEQRVHELVTQYGFDAILEAMERLAGDLVRSAWATSSNAGPTAKPKANRSSTRTA